MRFTFVVGGWPGLVHDMRVFTNAIRKYGDKFPYPPPGYLAPYKGTKYHVPKFLQGPAPKGKKELFNFAHSSLRNVIKRSFGVQNFVSEAKQNNTCLYGTSQLYLERVQWQMRILKCAIVMNTSFHSLVHLHLIKVVQTPI